MKHILMETDLGWVALAIEGGTVCGARLPTTRKLAELAIADWNALEPAERIGYPGAARAVGQAVGVNPIPLLIPCHRVVGSNGIGGFGGSINLKRKLLAAEGVHY
jgi:O-6-methylguanine DNA methyltransferase